MRENLKQENVRLKKELAEAKQNQKENYEAFTELKKRFEKLSTSYCYVTCLDHELS